MEDDRLTLQATTKTRCIRLDYVRGVEELREAEVALEAPVTLVVNGVELVTLFATPIQLKELALGHLLGQGVIRSIEEVKSIEVLGGRVSVETEHDVAERVSEYGRLRVITSACGSTEDFYHILDQIDHPYVKSDYTITLDTLIGAVRELNRLSVRGHLLAVHTSGLFEEGRLVAYAEDVGRHNSIDKVIGQAALKGIGFNSTILVTTGRQPADAVLKCARVGIPISVSIREPIHSGIFAAWRTGVTLVCGARGAKVDIYTHPRRIRYTFGSPREPFST